ncbi:DUF3581 family protein [uncultured Endozoicomonas sp.]|uniref:DUF3581 family protein n=1 Tax=uncultured Endozoicomonas sp. TaxID=432652 RepID=UPI00261775C5|nr:DUF3581 family protein [uncultured Endozoicomonas sp.]
MFLEEYCTTLAGDHFSFTREQASEFAKRVANDFNPLHDVDNTRFCVPGDLLFAKVLLNEGLHASMRFHFRDMLTDGVELEIVSGDDGGKRICDLNGKMYLEIESQGSCNRDTAMIEQLIKGYVAFSGESFPNVLVPLMKSEGVMINAVKPLVIYDSMTLKMEHVDLVNPQLESTGATLAVNGKRGKVTFNFAYRDNGEVVGMGEKTMILSGLRPYDQDTIDTMVESHRARQQRYSA